MPLQPSLPLALPPEHSPASQAAQSPAGFRHLAGWIAPAAQAALLQEVLIAVEDAGWYQPVMPRSGRPLSVMMCNLGPLGWVTDRRGYRYQPQHPMTGRAWPPMPARLLDLWQELADHPAPPESCLVNLYRDKAKLGLHQDDTEGDLEAPVISVSLGDDALFRLGGLERQGPTRSLRLQSGDVIVLGGRARLAFHGIDRIYPGTSALLSGGGRLNLTLRRVRPTGA